MQSSAILVASAVEREERQAADAANAATMQSMSADIKAANSDRTQIVRADLTEDSLLGGGPGSRRDLRIRG